MMKTRHSMKQEANNRKWKVFIRG